MLQIEKFFSVVVVVEIHFVISVLSSHRSCVFRFSVCRFYILNVDNAHINCAQKLKVLEFHCFQATQRERENIHR